MKKGDLVTVKEDCGSLKAGEKYVFDSYVSDDHLVAMIEYMDGLSQGCYISNIIVL